jgi:hypothetical protein
VSATLFPHAERVLRVDATPAVAASLLAEHVAARRFRLRGPQERFTGWVTGVGFQMTRTLGPFERSSFAPVIDGEITPAGDGADVRIRMRLNRFVAAFMAVWFAGVIFFAGTITGISLSTQPSAIVGLATSAFFAGVCGALFGFGYWLMSASFRGEAKRATALLCEALGATSADVGPGPGPPAR